MLSSMLSLQTRKQKSGRQASTNHGSVTLRDGWSRPDGSISKKFKKEPVLTNLCRLLFSVSGAFPYEKSYSRVCVKGTQPGNPSLLGGTRLHSVGPRSTVCWLPLRGNLQRMEPDTQANNGLSSTNKSDRKNKQDSQNIDSIICYQYLKVIE